MPVVSQAQNRAMRAAAAGHSTLGIPQSVAREFVSETHGMKVRDLPKRKAPAKRDPKPHKPFGSLAP